MNVVLLVFSILFLYQTQQALDLGQIAGEALTRFGGRIVSDAKKFKLQNSFEYTKAGDEKELLWILLASYGFTDTLGIEFTLPVFLKNTQQGFSSKGISDVIVGMQWQFFNQPEHTALLTGSLVFPTGSIEKIPTTGDGTIQIGLQFSALHTSEVWHCAFDVDVFLPIKRKRIDPGRQYLLELTFGRKIPTPSYLKIEDFYINSFLSIIYEEEDFCDGIVDPDSGGSVVFLGPLLSWTFKNIFFEFSIQGPIGQHIFGIQPKFDYTLFFSFRLEF